jgi:hypothetical protein
VSPLVSVGVAVGVSALTSVACSVTIVVFVGP